MMTAAPVNSDYISTKVDHG